MPKSPDAFRTISEVADWLGVQAHVLRFWESKFSQVKPIKRAGGRRYYRPTDMLLLGGIKQMLHEDGMTIKGVQKVLREKGVSFVSDHSPPLDDLTIAVIESKAEDPESTTNDTLEALPPESAEAETVSQTLSEDQDPEEETIATGSAETVQEDAAAIEGEVHTEPDVAVADEPPITSLEPDPEAEQSSADGAEAADEEEPEPLTEETMPDAAVEASEDTTEALPTFRAHARTQDATDPSEAPGERQDAEPKVKEEVPARDEPFSVTPPQPKEVDPKKPRLIDVGPLPEIGDFSAEPSALTALASLSHLSDAQAEEIRPLLARLTRLRASMANPRKDAAKD